MKMLPSLARLSLKLIMQLAVIVLAPSYVLIVINTNLAFHFLQKVNFALNNNSANNYLERSDSKSDTFRIG